MLGRLLGQFNSPGIKIPLGFLEKKSVGASEIKKPAAAAIAVNKLDAAGKFSSQDGLGGAIIRVAVAVLTGKIVAGVVGPGIEARGLRSSQAAAVTLPNIAAVGFVSKCVVRNLAAGRA